MSSVLALLLPSTNTVTDRALAVPIQVAIVSQITTANGELSTET